MADKPKGSFSQRLSALLFRLPAIQKRWAGGFRARETSGIPWTPLSKPLSECRVALVTTGGVHLTGDSPFDMEDKRGDPSYRVIPTETPAGELTITHDYYDHRDADRDINVVFPLPLLLELGEEGIIGSLSPNHYSLMGHIEGGHLDTLQQKTAPELAGRLNEDGVDAVIFSPA